MSNRCRIKHRVPLAKIREDIESGIRPARIVIQADNLSVAIEHLVQLHLFPVVNSKVASLIRVLPPKRKIGVTDGLK